MLLSRQRHNECIQIRRWLRRPHISTVSSQLCQMWRTWGTGGGGHRRLSGWQTVWRLLTLWLALWISLPASPSLSFSLDFSFPMFFSTCMPHYILKVNPINSEITLEDKLLRRAFFLDLITIAWNPKLHFASTMSTTGNSYRGFIRSDRANSLFSLKKYWIETKDKWRNWEMCWFT